MNSSLQHTRFDAQTGLSFLVSQAAALEAEIYRIQYADILYPSLIPVDTTAPEWIQVVEYVSADTVGRAQWFNGQAQDVPRADIVRDRLRVTVSMAAIGYGYDLAELEHARQYGIDLGPEKAEAARRAYEEFVDDIVLRGDAARGFSGLLSHPSVTAGTVANGASGNPDWAHKTVDEIIDDVNAALTGIQTASLRVEMADTVLLPVDRWLKLSQTRIPATSETALSFLARTNIYTLTTGLPLTVRGIPGLESAGASGIGRMIVYRRAPDVMKLHIPMPLQFLAPWQSGPMRFEVPGIFRLGGVDIRKPGAIRYLDGV
ncbi:DUF2184 domain-containing protein [Granulibacter bethesdensis]|uniref:DUF2184 domain-containing protein n=1 Tax=Granulibacter bethesdensis TaxID=364410 RepID=UPI00090A9278|nr:DUF2184 domain-containing protein [Granulibacter bethesdensis]APH59922.1 Phage-related protein [Granulibacter bethesdensis]